MKTWKTILAAAALALASSSAAFAARTDLVLAMTLEPPGLDAVDDVLLELLVARDCGVGRGHRVD